MGKDTGEFRGRGGSGETTFAVGPADDDRVFFRRARRKVRSTRKRYTAAERRVQILDAVVPVFAARGYARATVSRLEAVVPVSRPTMYSYFPSKAKLYAAALAHEAARVEAVLLPVLEHAHANDLVLHPGVVPPPGYTFRESGLEPTSRVIGVLVAWARKNPDSARLLLQRPIEEDEVVAANARVRQDIVDRIAALLQRDRGITSKRGLQRHFALRLHAEMLVGAVEAVMHWALANPLLPAQHLVRTWADRCRFAPGAPEPEVRPIGAAEREPP